MTARRGGAVRRLGLTGAVLLAGAVPAAASAAAGSAPPGACGAAHADGELVLRLNIPAFRLDALVGGVVVRSIRVAVGERRYATPVGEFAVTRVVWNPWWIPPPSEWARKDTVTPPGPENPMGKVKLFLRDSYFMHGTPFPVSIGRAVSHGCIRMHDDDAVALARLVMSFGGAAIAPASVDSLAGALLDTREVELPSPVPARIVYELAEVRGDSLALYRDIYRRDAGGRRLEALAALAGAGIDSSAIDAGRLAAALRRARSRSVTVALDALRRVERETPAPAPARPVDATTPRAAEAGRGATSGGSGPG